MHIWVLSRAKSLVGYKKKSGRDNASYRDRSLILGIQARVEQPLTKLHSTREPQDPSIDVSALHTICRLIDCKAFIFVKCLIRDNAANWFIRRTKINLATAGTRADNLSLISKATSLAVALFPRALLTWWRAGTVGLPLSFRSSWPEMEPRRSAGTSQAPKHSHRGQTQLLLAIHCWKTSSWFRNDCFKPFTSDICCCIEPPLNQDG